MKRFKQASTVAFTSMLLFSNAPMAMAAEVVPTKAVSSPASNPAFTPAPASGSKALYPIPEGGEAVSPDEAKITKEQAIELARSYVTIADGYQVQSVNLSPYGMAGTRGVYWNISFVKMVESKTVGNMNITIDGISGRLLNYSFYSNDPDVKPSYPPKVDYQGAKDVAAQWIAKLNAKEQSQLLYNDIQEQAHKAPLNGFNTYSIRYDRVHNGVRFPQNGINLIVNGDGVVTNYSFNWDPTVTFEEATPITKEAAAQAIREQAVLKLNYMMLYEAKGEKKPVISYTMNPIMLNASTGKPWSGAAGQGAVSQTDKPLTDEPLASPPASNLNLTKEQAFEKVSSVFKLPQGVKQGEASFNEFTDPLTGQVQSTWNLQWTEPASDSAISREGTRIWAAVNSKTGEINVYSHNTYNPYTDQKPVEPKVSMEDAQAKAVEFIKSHLPAYTHQLVLDTSMLNSMPVEQAKRMKEWNVPFKRIIDGVYANYEGVNISFDKMTGEVVNYNFNFTNVAYPTNKPETIAVNKAKELLLSPYVLKLNYVQPQQAGGPMPIEKMYSTMAENTLPAGPDTNNSLDKQAKLVYVLTPKYSESNFFLDAVTGQWRNSSNGEAISLEKVKVTDIEGHWAQKELRIMLDYQALDVVDGKVNPDASITRGELIKMLVITMNGGRSGIAYGAERTASFKDVRNDSPYFAYVENAVDRGLIDRGQPFNPQAIMNREEMAGLIVRALGYKKLTAYEQIFNSSFKDAASLSNRGETAIVVGLGIMTLNEGSFSPKQEVTRAQAATAFYRYLEKLAELKPDSRYVY